MLNRFMHSWVINGNQAVFCHKLDHCHKEKPRKAKKHAHFPETELRNTIIEIRINQPVNVDILHDQHQNGGRNQNRITAF